MLASAMFLTVFRAYQAPGWTQWAYVLTLACYPVLLVLLAMDRAWQALSINAMLVMLQAVYGVVAIWFVRFDDWVQRYLMRGIYLAIVALALFLMSPLVGMMQNDVVTVYPGFIFYLGLACFVNLTLIRRDFLAQLSVTEAQQREAQMAFQLEAEQARRQESASFLSMLLHELKTPLASIRLAALNFGRSIGESDAWSQKRLNTIHQSVDDINFVLERTREVDRFDQAALQSHRTSFDLGDWIDDMVATQSQAARIDVDCPAAAQVHLDRSLTSLMLRNLLENALRYSPRDSRVRLTARVSPGVQEPDALPAQLSLTVHNSVDQRAMPDEARLFGKYYRADTSHDHTGVGLGLYWVRGVARQLGGDVQYRALGDTVAFELTLPCA